MSTPRTARAVTGTVLAVTLLTPLAACSDGASGNASSAKAGTYSFWDPYPQFDASSPWGKRVTACGAQADVKIKRTPMDTTDRANKALLAGQQDNLPDVMLVDNPAVSTLAEAGILAKAADAGLKTIGIQKNILDAGTVDDEPYGVPIGANTLALYYNTDVPKKAKVDPAAVTDWKSLTAALAKVETAGSKGITFSATKSEEGSFQFLPWFWGGREPNSPRDASPSPAHSGRGSALAGADAIGPRCLAHGPAERVDERAGRRPPALPSRFADVRSFRQQHHGMEDPDVGPPLRIRHAELGPEQPGQGALAHADALCQPGRRPRMPQVVGHQRARLPQQGVAGGGQRQRLDEGPPQPVPQDGAQAACLRLR
ncbi:hypothetical protein QF026_008084 [Streptomyces aurantiacus]|nr:hypothetical protein [Streptomyces aurantiacus]